MKMIHLFKKEKQKKIFCLQEKKKFMSIEL